MNRRSFVGLFASAVALIPFAGFASTPERMKLTVIHEPQNKWYRVVGSFEAKKKFHFAWQTKLWPEWQQHIRPLEERTAFLWDMMQGHDGLFSTPNRQVVEAIKHAISNCGCVVTVL
jgi:hypothetical protein